MGKKYQTIGPNIHFKPCIDKITVGAMMVVKKGGGRGDGGGGVDFTKSRLKKCMHRTPHDNYIHDTPCNSTQISDLLYASRE